MEVMKMAIVRHVVLVVLVASGTLVGPEAFAQDTRSLGLVMGYPAVVGVLWQVSPRIAIRPELTVETGTSESTSSSNFGTFRFSSDSWQVGGGVSALLLLHRADGLSLYVSPRYVLRTGEITRENSSPQGVVTVRGSNEISGHTVSGAFGAHYTMSARFGIFGELGVSHDRDSTSSSIEGQTNDNFRTIRTGMRSGIGVVFFF
jgi:hypothetical protein